MNHTIYQRNFHWSWTFTFQRFCACIEYKIMVVWHHNHLHNTVLRIVWFNFPHLQRYAENGGTKTFTLHIGRWGSLRLTSRLSLFKSKCTIFFPCKYSIPNATSIEISRRQRRSNILLTEETNIKSVTIWKASCFCTEQIVYFSCLSNACRSEPLAMYSVTVATDPPGLSRTTP